MELVAGVFLALILIFNKYLKEISSLEKSIVVFLCLCVIMYSLSLIILKLNLDYILITRVSLR